MIWEHKVYRDRPTLVAGDGPIGVFRKWAAQFYEAARASSGLYGAVDVLDVGRAREPGTSIARRISSSSIPSRSNGPSSRRSR